jgi:hypothetical protein
MNTRESERVRNESNCGGNEFFNSLLDGGRFSDRHRHASPAGVGPVEPGDNLRGRIQGLIDVELTIGPPDKL